MTAMTEEMLAEFDEALRWHMLSAPALNDAKCGMQMLQWQPEWRKRLGESMMVFRMNPHTLRLLEERGDIVLERIYKDKDVPRRIRRVLREMVTQDKMRHAIGGNR